MSGKSKVEVPIRSRLAASTTEATIDAAVAGVGLARVSSFLIAEAIRAGTLKAALERFEPVPRSISLIHSGQGIVPLKLRALLDFAGPRLKARLEALGI